MLHHLQGRRIHDRGVLKGLIKVHGELDKMDKATQKSLKKEIDQRCKSLEAHKERISYYETQLGQEPSEGNAPDGDGQVCHGAQAEMAPALAPADDAPSESTILWQLQPLIPLQLRTKLRTWRWMTMPLAPVYPVIHEDDDLLSGPPQSEVTEVESGLAHLSVSSPRGLNGEGEEASH